MNLFTPVIPEDRLHPVFRMLMQSENAPERALLGAWSDGMPDRDGKFVKEFQSTFESSLWELYLHACLKELGHSLDFSHVSPDFVVTEPIPFVLEATISAPALGQPSGFGVGPPELPDDLNEFNRDAIVRICNSFDAEVRRYRDYYCTLPHVNGRPYVIAIAPFDRPAAHLAANRPIVGALYGMYFDEEATMAEGRNVVIRHPIDGIPKKPGVEVPVGLFANADYKEVSAVVYGPLATWGKLRALADAPDKAMTFTTLHPNPDGLMPLMRREIKANYVEHLVDGLYVLHNPYAAQPLSVLAFQHPRIAQYVPYGPHAVREIAPDDFLLMRMIWSVTTRPSEG